MFRSRCHFPCFVCYPVCVRHKFHHCRWFSHRFPCHSFAKGVALGLLFGFF